MTEGARAPDAPANPSGPPGPADLRPSDLPPPGKERTRQVAGRAIGGLRWTATSFVLRTGFHVLVTAILARLVAPSEFGLVALTVVFTAFIGIVQDFGLGSALVQRARLDREHETSMFWANLGLGSLMALLLIAAAPLGAWFFHQPRLAPLLVFLSLNYVIGSFATVQRMLLSRRLQFNTLARIEVASTVLGGVVAVAVAFAGGGVWALAIQTTINVATSTVLLWSNGHWRPSRLFSWPHLKDLLGYGANTTGVNVLGYVYRYADNILIGRVLGVASLGFYDLSYRLFRQPIQNVQAILTKVMFPTLSALNTDLPAFRAMFRRTMVYLFAALVPVFALLHAAAPDVILGIYGPTWRPAIPLLRILAVIGLLQSLAIGTSWIYQSLGRMDLALRVSVTLGLVPILAAMVIGLQWGILGVAYAILAVVAVLLYPSMAIPYRLVGLRVSDLARDVRGILVAGLAGAGTVYALRWWLMPRAPDLPNLVWLAIEGMALVLVYAAVLALVDRRLVRRIVRMAGRFAGRGATPGAQTGP